MPTIDEPTWWIGRHEDAEAWEGPYASREEAIDGARDSDYDWICSARQARYSASDLLERCDVDHMIEDWAENSDMAGEDGQTPFDHWSAAHKEELMKHLKAAADSFMAASGLNPRAAWMVYDMTRAERVPAIVEVAE